MVKDKDIEGAIERILARREALEAELKEIDRVLALCASLGDKLADAHAKADQPRIEAVASAGVHDRESSPKTVKRPARKRGAARAQFVEKTRGILLNHGRPLTAKQIWERFADTNDPGARKLALNSLRVKLVQLREHFVSIPDEGYWPRDTACAAVKYVPGRRTKAAPTGRAGKAERRSPEVQ